MFGFLIETNTALTVKARLPPSATLGVPLMETTRGGATSVMVPVALAFIVSGTFNTVLAVCAFFFDLSMPDANFAAAFVVLLAWRTLRRARRAPT